MATEEEPDATPALRPAEHLARARAELRLGHPVILSGPEPTGTAVIAAERVSARWLAVLRAVAGDRLDLVLSRPRAETLRVRVYDGDLARIPLPAEMDAAALAILADPSRDLEYPLRGPFAARRGGDIADAAAALRLLHHAGLLAAALIAPVPAPWRQVARLDRAHLPASGRLARVEHVVAARMPVAPAEDARIHLFRDRDTGEEHLALETGPPMAGQPATVRIHSSCYTGDVLDSLRCDCGPQLREAIRLAVRDGGVIVLLQQEGRGIGLANKIRAYRLQDEGFDTYEANRRLGFGEDERDFAVAAAILQALGCRRVRLLTGNPEKVAALHRHGIEVAATSPHAVGGNPHNAAYLRAKRQRADSVRPPPGEER